MIVPNMAGNWDIVDFVRQAYEGGFSVESRYLPEEGLKGYVASKRSFPPGRTYGPVSLEAYFLCYPLHGSALVPEESKVTVAEWEEQCELHKKHDGFEISFLPASMENRMVCHCKAGEGKSVVLKVSARKLKIAEDRASDLAGDIIEIMMEEDVGQGQ